MSKKSLAFAAALALSGGARAAAQQPTPASPVLDAMKVELARSLDALRASPSPPYCIGYDVTEVQEFSVSSSFGAITARADERRRALDVQLRVGSYAFDNTHVVHSDFPDFMRFVDGPVDIPVDDDPMAIRAALWYETQQRYRNAVEQLSDARTNARLRVAPEDSSPDFSRESPERFVEPAQVLTIDRGAWEEKLRRYTAPFAQQRDIYGANAFFTATVETHWYVNTEGTEIQTSQPGYRLIIWAFSKAEDGMQLPRYESFFAATPEGMPNDQTVLQAVARMITDLQALRRAPIVDAYTGPAILSGRASAVFFHEILGHRLEGHRLKDEDDAQTFTRRVADEVLAPGFSVYFDPTLRTVGNTDLAGYYRYDDEGVRARRVAVIEHGVLKTFLMSRMPIEGFANSNGHGRRQVGFSPVARQSNLIVQVAAPKTRAQLKQQLLQEIHRQRKPFGLFFDDIEGGFTITRRGFPNAFEVLPVMVYRVFPDGREELVRGVDLIGTPLTVFSRVTAGDDQVAVFNGMCGAESGSVPVSAVSPAVLVSQIEVQKKPKSSERPPILPPPAATSSAGDSTDVVMRALRDELARSMADLRLDTMPKPYFLSYRVDEVTHLNAAATRGSLVNSDRGTSRRLSVELRVGDYTFDNSNFLGMPRSFAGMIGDLDGSMGELPLDDDYAALRRQVWLATDQAYKVAVTELAQKRTALANRTRRTELPDFSREEPVTLVDDVPVPRLDQAAAAEMVRATSAVFRDAPDIYQSSVTWSGGAVRTWYVNSEGSAFTRTAPWGSVRVSAVTQARDGMPLEDGVSYYAASPELLPKQAALTRQVRSFATRLSSLRATAAAETYNGPVLFEGDAAAVLFASMFGSQLAANRPPISDNPMFDRFGGTSSGMLDLIGARVLPKSFSVVENPGARVFEGQPIGGALVDDEGVRTRETRLVDRGVLRTLLTTRTPVEGLPRSTGSRRGSEATPTNVFVTTDSGLGDAPLRQRALALAREHGTPYAVVVRRFAGGAGGRSIRALMAAMRPSEGSLPIAEAVKVYGDGREEPIRGAALSGVSATSFKDIVAASRARTATTLPTRGMMGAGMVAMVNFMPRGFQVGLVPQMATYVVPSLLFDDVAIRKPTEDGLAPPAFAPPWSPK
ncbi:MAG: metallopeptidase TldD-related protein [Gemmatimonadota bacterium]